MALKVSENETIRGRRNLEELLPSPIFITRGTEKYQMYEGMQQRINEIT